MNTDKLMELERKWRERADLEDEDGVPYYTEDQRQVMLKDADELAAALRAEQAVGDEQIARELLAEAERGPICDYGTVHRQVAHSAIRRALGTARQSEPRQNFMGKGRTIAAQSLHAARQSEGVVLVPRENVLAAAALLEGTGNVVDRREAEVLRKFAAAPRGVGG